ncbi:DUF1289 domain-containing protein [Parathalassolituus penaei]|uniref:DUF1289 domain-containing protein n=1 Tax=Parathalassolituus penaei TaxID=2997323 RepID=A0A9X3EFW9_9GAMM|nr:DUF1289 domain-containing protein [Parathalassolituus penaei]MCY0966827.1 DUF1289 domain-containing protein [Parathalassolituus penaei]
MTQFVRSPCVHVCVLDDQEICTGCYRSGEEIARWGRMTPEAKQEVLARCYEREEASINFIPVTPVSR